MFFSTTPNPSSKRRGQQAPVAPNEETPKKTRIEGGGEAWVLELLADGDVCEGVEKNLDVEPPRAMLQIVEVEFEATQHLFHRIGIAVIKCSIRRHARPYLIKIGVAVVVFHDLLDEVFALGTRTNERHFTLCTFHNCGSSSR